MNTSRMKVICALLLTICYVGVGCSQDKKPNVIVIITDDQGYGDLGYTGNPHVKTPHIDKFAGESMRFNNFYVSFLLINRQPFYSTLCYFFANICFKQLDYDYILKLY